MAHRERGTAAEMLGELESAADRLGEWLQNHIAVVSVAVVGLLAVAGLGSWIVSARADKEEEASNALAQARADYLAAMGAPAGSIEVPELANPAAAKEIRAEYEKRYAEVAAEHEGTVAAALARLEQAAIATSGGRTDEAIAVLEQAIAKAPEGAVRGVVTQRLAQRFEAAGRWAEAADRHEAASKLTDYPLHQWALADAARCRAMAGDADAARALYDRLDREAPDLPLSDDQRSQRLELRAAAAG
jgi:predicted negative regulator of RcsB-dependent stress response